MKRRRSSSSSNDTYVTADSEVKDQYTAPATLRRQVSPPPVRKESNNFKSATAKVEAGEATVEDHVAFFASKLLAARLPEVASQSRISHNAWLDLYNHNLTERGHHFVIHQHDHPVAGTHYDLRLQCNATSSLSFALMYGLPGDPNSRRLNRNATETRVHNLWNHVIETASVQTGTMLIWDTGEYEVLPYATNEQAAASDSEDDAEVATRTTFPDKFSTLSEPQKLARAFTRRKICLRLHGTRLPPTYTLSLRLTTENFRSEQPVAPTFRRRGKSRTAKQKNRRPSTTSDSESDTSGLRRTVSSLQATASPPSSPPPPASQEENEIIRANNAYLGARNSIGSIHQKKWFLSLDRAGCGFVQTKKPPSGHHAQTYWIRPEEGRGEQKGGFEKFHVLGRDYERSVVTGRLARDILADENCENFVPRGRWRAVIE